MISMPGTFFEYHLSHAPILPSYIPHLGLETRLNLNMYRAQNLSFDEDAC